MMNTPILKVEKLNIKFPDADKAIVKDGSFEVNSGEIVLILGENGSGKSSIFRSLVGEINQGFLVPLINRIKNPFKKNEKTPPIIEINYFLDGEQINSNNLEEFRKKIGYVRQHDNDDEFFQKKVWDYVIDYVSSSYHYTHDNNEKNRLELIKADAQSVYDALDCNAYAKGKLKKLKIKHLSGGEKRITTILSALARKHSRLFILDEPVNNLDGYHARKLNNYLVDLKKQENAPGILIITHCPMFPVVDRVYILKNGTLIEQDMQKYQFQTCFGEVDKKGKYIE